LSEPNVRTGLLAAIGVLFVWSGFIVFALASMQNLVTFGILTSLAIVLAFLADVIVAPAVSTEDAEAMFPKGVVVARPYLRTTPQPNR